MIDLDSLDKLAREARTRADATTPEPWAWRNFGDDVLVADHGRRDIIIARAETRDPFTKTLKPAGPWHPNMQFIASARTDLPALADAVLMLTTQVRQLTIELEVFMCQRDAMRADLAALSRRLTQGSGRELTHPCKHPLLVIDRCSTCGEYFGPQP